MGKKLIDVVFFLPRFVQTYQGLVLKVVCKAVDERGLSHAGLPKDEDGKAVKGLEVVNEIGQAVLLIELKVEPVVRVAASEAVVDKLPSPTGAVQEAIKSILELKIRQRYYIVSRNTRNEFKYLTRKAF